MELSENVDEKACVKPAKKPIKLVAVGASGLATCGIALHWHWPCGGVVFRYLAARPHLGTRVTSQ